MKYRTTEAEFAAEICPDHLAQAIRQIVRVITSLNDGSVEVTIHDSKVVQIERREKFRFDRG
jgi:hypothetical protein